MRISVLVQTNSPVSSITFHVVIYSGIIDLAVGFFPAVPADDDAGDEYHCCKYNNSHQCRVNAGMPGTGESFLFKKITYLTLSFA
jgi:hypothetical protein